MSQYLVQYQHTPYAMTSEWYDVDQADDAQHAVEQVQDAYPTCVVLGVWKVVDPQPEPGEASWVLEHRFGSYRDYAHYAPAAHGYVLRVCLTLDVAERRAWMQGTLTDGDGEQPAHGSFNVPWKVACAMVNYEEDA